MHHSVLKNFVWKMFNARLSVEKRVRCVRLYSVTGNVAEVRRQILQEYGPPAPKRDTIARLNKQFDSTGSVLDAKKTGQEMCRKCVAMPATTLNYACRHASTLGAVK